MPESFNPSIDARARITATRVGPFFIGLVISKLPKYGPKTRQCSETVKASLVFGRKVSVYADFS